jgi:putative SOS response-associated peptidase YedK
LLVGQREQLHIDCRQPVSAMPEPCTANNAGLVGRKIEQCQHRSPPHLEHRFGCRRLDIIRPSSVKPGAAELVQRPWSWPNARGKPVFNFRSEGREFASGRCLIVADGFFEFTADPDAQLAKRARKKRWLFTKNGEPWFCIAGLWRTDEQSGEAYTMLTTNPGPDVAPYHDRQVAILHREQWGRWLDLSKPVKGLIGPLAAGTLKVAPV